MRNCTVLVALVALILGTASLAHAGAIVYESFNHPVGDLNGRTADSGLGTWSAGGIYDITSPGMSYTDGNGSVLPVAGNMLTQQWGGGEASAATLVPDNWSDASHYGGKLNKLGATIWWSVIMNEAPKDIYTENEFLVRNSGDSGYFGIETNQGTTSWRLVGQNDDGDGEVSSAYFANFTNNLTFVVMKLDTHATSGDTTLSAWLDPLIDDESNLGTPNASITVGGNDSGYAATQFNQLRARQPGHKAYPRFDEIRMGETFNSVVGLADAGIEVTGTAGAWDVTRVENPAPEILEVDKTAVDLDPFDMEIEVTGGLTTVNIDETVLNDTMLDWTDYHVQLGTGLGVDFVASLPGDGLSFISGTSATFPTLTWLSEDELAFSGSIVGPLNSDTLQLQIELPGEDPFTFTLRQWPTTTVIPEPSTLAIWALGLLGLVLCARRRKR